MPIIKSAKKALRGSLKKKVFNDRRKKTMKVEVKSIRALIVEKDKKAAIEKMPALYKAIDKAAKRGIIKKNTAARKKSRIAHAIAKIA